MFCKIYRWAIERQLDDHGTISQKQLRGHLEKCPRCSRYHQQLMQLNTQLTSNVLDRLHESDYRRIEAAVRQQFSDAAINRIQMQGSRPPQPTRWRPVIQSIAAAIVVGVVAGWWILAAGRRAQRIDMLAQLSHDSRQLQTQTAMLLTLPEQSMQTEFRNLVNDAKRAATFIRDCTPANPAAQNSQAEPTHQPQTH